MTEVNPYDYVVRLRDHFILFHGSHDPLEAFRRLDLAIEELLSFEIDANLVPEGEKLFPVNAHSPMSYPDGSIPVDDLREIHPCIYLRRLKGHPIPVKLDLKTPDLLNRRDVLIQIASMVPQHLRIGAAFLWELTFSGVRLEPWQEEENFNMSQFLKAKELLGHVPFVASARGLTFRDAKDRATRDLIGKTLAGRAEIVNLNLLDLPDDLRELWLEVVRPLWEVYGIVSELWVNSQRHLQAYTELSEAYEVPFLGLTDDPKLATSVTEIVHL